MKMISALLCSVLLLSLIPEAESLWGYTNLSYPKSFTTQQTINGNQIIVGTSFKSLSKQVDVITFNPDDCSCNNTNGFFDSICSVETYPKPFDYRANAGFWAGPDGLWIVGGNKDYVGQANPVIDIFPRNLTTGRIGNSSFNWTTSFFMWENGLSGIQINGFQDTGEMYAVGGCWLVQNTSTAWYHHNCSANIWTTCDNVGWNCTRTANVLVAITAKMTDNKGRFGVTTIQIGDYLIYAGGCDDITRQATNFSEVYYRVNKTWLYPKMPYPQCWMKAVKVGPLAIFIGGLDETGNTTARIQIFNSTSGTWLNANKSIPTSICPTVFMHAATSMDSLGLIYFMGGCKDNACVFRTTTTCFINVTNFNNWIWMNHTMYMSAYPNDFPIGPIPKGGAGLIGMSASSISTPNCSIAVFAGGGVDLLADYRTVPYRYQYAEIYVIPAPDVNGLCASFHAVNLEKRRALYREKKRAMAEEREDPLADEV